MHLLHPTPPSPNRGAFIPYKTNARIFLRSDARLQYLLYPMVCFVQPGPKTFHTCGKYRRHIYLLNQDGSTVLNFDLDIFSVSTPQIYLIPNPSPRVEKGALIRPSSQIKTAFLYSGFEFRNASISSSTPSTMFTLNVMAELQFDLQPKLNCLLF